ncbi:uncharacterized protein LOC125179510, partial [Hyalella azteca]|uniref:Uncharacterized protein LOC125179510 n=1 Tax=Hyalella azteca TaxID=294128 RepID=A0A979FY33_HYAAZ
MTNSYIQNQSWVSHLPEEDKYRFINKKCVDKVIPKVLRKVLEWGCKKEPDQTYFEYISLKCKCNLKKLFQFHERQLDSTSSESYDTSMLYEVIPFACEGVTKTRSCEWAKAKEDPTTLEYHLYRVKVLRNSVIHDPEGKGVSKNFITEVGRPLRDLILVSARKFNVDRDEAEEFCASVASDIQTVEEGIISCREKEVSAVLKAVRTQGKIEMKAKREAYLTEECLPFSQIKVPLNEVFHSITLVCENTQREVNCNELFAETEEDSAQCVVVQGAAGSGKSTLVKRIALDFLEIAASDSIFHGLNLFGAILHIECRETKVSTLGQFVRNSFPLTLKIFTDFSQDAAEAVLNSRTLIIIDGMDNLTSITKELVKDVLKTFNGGEGSRMLVTSRPSAAKDFIQDLEAASISHDCYSIKDISVNDEQLKFLRRYEKVIPDIRAPDLVEAFKGLQGARSYFIYPVYLALFCHLFRTNPEGVNCLTSPENLMEQTLRLGEVKVEQRVSEHVIVNPDIVASIICDKICDLSLKCLHMGEHKVDSETYKEFCQECYKVIGKELPYKSILSCLMTAKKSRADPTEGTFEWFHKSFAEYLAAKTLIRTLRARKDVDILQVISEITGMPVTEADLKRYQNVILFTVLYINSDSRKLRLGSSLRQLLRLLSTTSTPAQDWIRIVNLWPDDDEVAKIAARSAAVSSSEWRVQDSNDCGSVARMLPHSQPLILNLALPRSVSTPPLILAAIGQHFKGTLKLDMRRSHDNFMPCDDMVEHNLSGARCGLVQFRGCLGGREAAAAALGAAVDEAGGL